MHGIVTSGSRPRKPSRLLSALNAAFTFAFVPGMSDFAFGIVSTFTPPPPRTDLTPLARCVKPGVAGLVDDDQDLLRAGLLELLAGALPRDVLRLADVDLVRRQRVECTEARVDRDDLDPLLRRLRERIPKGARVRHRRRDHVHAGADCRVEPRHLRCDVVVRVHLRDAHAARPQVLLRLVDALLEDRPERAGVAVGDDRDLDAARLGRLDRAERGGRPRTEHGRSRGEQSAPDEQVAPAEPALLLQVDEFTLTHVPLPSFTSLTAVLRSSPVTMTSFRVVLKLPRRSRVRRVPRAGAARFAARGTSSRRPAPERRPPGRPRP